MWQLFVHSFLACAMHRRAAILHRQCGESFRKTYLFLCVFFQSCFGWKSFRLDHNVCRLATLCTLSKYTLHVVLRYMKSFVLRNRLCSNSKNVN